MNFYHKTDDMSRDLRLWVLGFYSLKNLKPYTAWKLSIFEVILVRIFPHLDWARTRITPNMDTFYAVLRWERKWHCSKNIEFYLKMNGRSSRPEKLRHRYFPVNCANYLRNLFHRTSANGYFEMNEWFIFFGLPNEILYKYSELNLLSNENQSGNFYLIFLKSKVI